MIKLVSLASGSSGNCTLVTAGGTNILVDAGISLKRIEAGLRECGLSAGKVDRVFITHEHSDHVLGLEMLLKHTEVAFCAPRTVASRLMGKYPRIEDRLHIISTQEPVCVGDMLVKAFDTMHDTPQSVGYRIEADVAVGVCTDLGCVTDEVKEALRGVRAALIEANHDEEMLRYGKYPVYLKRRILSDRGHLSNEACGELAAHLAENGAESIILGHLSRENNRPERAFSRVMEALAAKKCDPALYVAPDNGFMGAEARL